MSPGRYAPGIRMPTLEGLLTHTHRLHVNTGILSPRHGSSWRLWPFCPLTAAPNTVQDTRPEVQPPQHQEMGAGWLLGGHGHPLLPDCSMYGFLGLAQLSSHEQTHRELWLSFLPGHLRQPRPLLFRTRPLSGHKIDPEPLLGWDPRGCLCPEENASCSAFERGHGSPEPLGNILPAPPAHPATLETHAKGPSSPALGLPGLILTTPHTNASSPHIKRRGPAQAYPAGQG